MRQVEVCLTPELIHQFDLEGKIVVVIDIFRATSCIVSGMASGVKEIYPVETVEECLALGEKGMVTAGERGGKKIPEFDIGNSPFQYMKEEMVGKQIAVSTTNGTLTIKRSLTAKEVLVAAFLNLEKTASYILNQDANLILHCAGWKGTVNLEDTLFAGAMIDRLENEFEKVNDSAFLAESLYKHHESDLLKAATMSSHAKRLSGFGIQKDIEFCMTLNEFDVVVKYDRDRLLLH